MGLVPNGQPQLHFTTKTFDSKKLTLSADKHSRNISADNIFELILNSNDYDTFSPINDDQNIQESDLDMSNPYLMDNRLSTQMIESVKSIRDEIVMLGSVAKERIKGCYQRRQFRKGINNKKKELIEAIKSEIKRIYNEEFSQTEGKELYYTLKGIYKDEFPYTFLPVLIVSSSESFDYTKPKLYLIETLKVKDTSNRLEISRYYAHIYGSGLCKLVSHSSQSKEALLVQYDLNKIRDDLNNGKYDPSKIQYSTGTDSKSENQFHEIFNAVKELFHVHSHHSDENYSADCIIGCEAIPAGNVCVNMDIALKKILDQYRIRIIRYHELVSVHESRIIYDLIVDYAKLAQGVFYYAVNFLKIFNIDLSRLGIDVNSEIDAFDRASKSMEGISSHASSSFDIRYGRTIRVTSIALGAIALVTAIACTLYSSYPCAIGIACVIDALLILALFCINFMPRKFYSWV